MAKDVVVDEIDDTTITGLVQELTMDDPINPLFKQAQFAPRWNDYGSKLLMTICATIDAKRADILRGGLQAGFPLVIACKYMTSVGDRVIAKELMGSFLSGIELPPEHSLKWEHGLIFLSSDSVLKFKAAISNKTIEQDLRDSLSTKAFEFCAWTEDKITRYGKRCSLIDVHLPDQQAIVFKHVVEDNLVRTQEMMLTNLAR